MALPYDYYPAVLYALDVISQGDTITEACDQANISVATFESYTRKDENLQELRMDAERRGHDALAEALIHIDNHRIHGQSDPKMAKVISDNIKWLLAKKNPDKFGDRIKVDHEMTVDVVITSALEAARQRTAPAIEHAVEEAVILAVQSNEEVMSDLLS